MKIRSILVLLLVAPVLVWNSLHLSQEKKSMAEDKKKGPKVAHMVYFTLKESDKESRAKLVGACQKYLKEHPGVEYFSAGTLAEDFDREVNVRDWDVALHLVFDSKESHDIYQDAEKHVRFIEENKATWEKVKVFDSYVD